MLMYFNINEFIITKLIKKILQPIKSNSFYNIYIYIYIYIYVHFRETIPQARQPTELTVLPAHEGKFFMR